MVFSVNGMEGDAAPRHDVASSGHFIPCYALSCQATIQCLGSFSL